MGVSLCLRDEEAAGSNPATPTSSEDMRLAPERSFLLLCFDTSAMDTGSVSWCYVTEYSHVHASA